ncbi:MAG: histidine phosphatase family protein [Anaerolineales bacterium]|nr:histidine phosphatase family protein [Anaerolineales bacterium]
MISASSSSLPYQLVLTRHGQSVGNAERRHQGQADFPLTQLGRSQTQQLAAYWKNQEKSFDYLISSPLLRAKNTADILARELELEVVLDPIWMERDNGKLAGLLHDEAQKKLPQPDFIPLYQPIAETGESQWELFLRAGKAINTILSADPGSYLIVGHGGLFNQVMHAVLGLTPQPNFQGPRFRFFNSGFSELEYLPDKGTWNIHNHNTRPHLEADPR